MSHFDQIIDMWTAYHYIFYQIFYNLIIFNKIFLDNSHNNNQVGINFNLNIDKIKFLS